jgi:hypothetical protein
MSALIDAESALGIQVVHFNKGLVGHCFKPIDNPIVDVDGFVEFDYTPAQVVSPHISLLAY